MKKLLVITGLILAAFIAGRTSVTQPQVAENRVYTQAWRWCQERIYHGDDPDYFTMAAEQIKRREIRWSINDPSGLHYEMLIAFADAMDKLETQMAVTPQEFARTFVQTIPNIVKTN